MSTIRIEKLRIKNFRCFQDETIYLNDYTCFIGPNGSGKSTILHALNVFFRHTKDASTDLSRLSDEDFHHKNVSEPIEITVTFCDLSEEASEDLRAYVRQERLVVSARAQFNKNTQQADVKQYGRRMVIKRFAEFFNADKQGLRVADLREVYRSIRDDYPELADVTTKSDMTAALREYEESHPQECELIDSEDQFYGFSRGVNRLGKHVQWAYIPAAKNIVEEGTESKGSVLGDLLERTVRSKIDFGPKLNELRNKTQEEYRKILNAESPILDEITAAIEKNLKIWSHPRVTAGVKWGQDLDRTVRLEAPTAEIELGERDFLGEMARFGHGLQRSFLLAIMQELVGVTDGSQPTLIMGIEEPELYQHPPQVRYLAELLLDLSSGNSQIMVCSHSPLFIPRGDLEAARLIREKKNPSNSYCTQICYQGLNALLLESGQKDAKDTGIVAKLYPSLNPLINEMFFCSVLILVEGMEDSAYIYSYLELEKRLNDFRRYGCHIVPAGGKSMIIKPLAIANLLDIPVFVVFDADTNKTKNDEIIGHRKENESIQRLLGERNPDAWPGCTKWKDNYVMWVTNLTDMIRNELGQEWSKYMQIAYNKYANPGGLQKNPLAIAYALESAWNDGLKSSSLRRLADSILDFASLA